MITRLSGPQARAHSRTVFPVSISRKDIEHIAHLSRLDVAEEDVAAYTDKLGRIIDFIDALESADTGDLVPMAHPFEMTQRLRDTQDGLYIVPRVVE